MKAKIKKIIQFIINPRLVLCWGMAWIITNGWSYIMLALGTYFDITWMKALGGSFITFLWLPVSPEKIVTAAIAIVLLRVLFPNDKKTLAVLKDLYAKAKSKLKKRKTEKTGEDDIEDDSTPCEVRE